MNILVTGAFGGIGTEVLKIGHERGHSIYAFDLDNSRNRKKSAIYSEILTEIIWGDLRKPEDVREAVEGKDTIVHLGAVITPLSETLPELSYAVNVGGTENIIRAISEAENNPGLVFTSSMSIMGASAERIPPLKASDPVYATSNYTAQKIECEKMLNASDIKWTTGRLGAVINVELSAGGGSIRDLLDEVFAMPLKNRIEGIWNIDAAAALISAAESLNRTDEISRKTLMIGGGKDNGWQLTVRDFYTGVFDAIGFGLPEESSFSDKPYYADWLDTEESQRLLNYQNHSFDEFLFQLKKEMGLKRTFSQLLAPVIRNRLTRLSAVASANKKAAAL